MSDDMQAYREVFLSESAEYIEGIVEGMIALENNPNDLEPVEVVFRGAHSLKGMAAAMGYERTADLTHKMESLMATVRDRRQVVDAEMVDLVLRAVDAVKALIDDESNGRTEYDAAGMVAELIRRTEQGATPEAAGAEGAIAPVPANAGAAPEAPTPDATPAGREMPVLATRVTLDEACVLKSVRAYMVIKRLSHLGTVVETHPPAQDIEDEKFDRTFEVWVRTPESVEEVTRAISAVSEVGSVQVEEHVEEARPVETAVVEEIPGAPARRAIPKLSETQTVRISIGHLDTMVNLVGELVINRSRIENIARREGIADLLEATEDLYRVSSDLQHEVMQTRMVPVGNIFNRFPRMVRDLARDLRKEIVFEMDGLDIELDRTVLDEIGDPLVHLLRNAVDHGIESVEQRAAAGKPVKGLVRLSAARERDQVQVIVSDDGAGMDVDHIWNKACERGLVTSDQREAFSSEDVLMMTCTPGFSTAETATKVSGRGVGMDVVRGKIEYLGGSVVIRSIHGQGTEFVLSLPLTLAIIQAIMVKSGDRVFALPLGSVTEVFASEDVEIDSVEGGPVIRLRDGRVAPLHNLDWLIGVGEDPAARPAAGESVVLVEYADQARALTVREMAGRQEVVIKPLSRMFKNLRGLSGATVLGDGSVAFILDPRMMFGMGEERS